jgi:hypothetical protein
MPYVTQSVLLLVAPALFAASIYMTLGRIIRCVKGEKRSIIRVNWLTKLFVIGDVLSFFVQGGGAGMIVTGKNAKLGENVVVAGLFIQITNVWSVIIMAVIFHTRMYWNPTTESFNVEALWKQTLYMLYGVSVLIMVRSIFRVTEYLLGQDGYPLTHEWKLYIFDALLMLTIMVGFYFRYPSTVIPAPAKVENLQMYTHQPKA